MSETLAKRYFEIDMQHMALSDEVSDALNAAFGDDGWSDWTADWYDESIEVYGAERTDKAIEALRAAGFAQCWIHPHPKGEPRFPCGCKGLGLRTSPPPHAHPRDEPAVLAHPARGAVSDEESETEGGPGGDDVG